MKLLPALLLLAIAADAPRVTGREPVVGLPCEGCEAVFQGIPEAIASATRVAPDGEKGEPLVLRGRVTTADGAPAAGIVIYAYQTNATGIYPTPNGLSGAASRHGRLRGQPEILSKAFRRKWTSSRPRSRGGRHVQPVVGASTVSPRQAAR